MISYYEEAWFKMKKPLPTISALILDYGGGDSKSIIRTGSGRSSPLNALDKGAPTDETLSTWVSLHVLQRGC